MAKQGMKRIDRSRTKPKNELPPVPEIQGKAKSGKVKSSPMTNTDLGKDNIENDLPKADVQDL